MAEDNKQQKTATERLLQAIKAKDEIEVNEILSVTLGDARGVVAVDCRRAIDTLMKKPDPLDAKEETVLRRLVENVYLLGNDPHADINTPVKSWNWGSAGGRSLHIKIFDPASGELLIAPKSDSELSPQQQLRNDIEYSHQYLQSLQNSWMARLVRGKKEENSTELDPATYGPQHFPLKAYVDKLKPKEAKCENEHAAAEPQDERHNLLCGTLILLAAQDNKCHYFRDLITDYHVGNLIKPTWYEYLQPNQENRMLNQEISQAIDTKSNNFVKVLLQPIEVKLNVLLERLGVGTKRAEYLAMLAKVRAALTEQAAENLGGTHLEIENLRKIAAYVAAFQDMVSSFVAHRSEDERKAIYANVLAKADALPFASATEKKKIFITTALIFLSLTALTALLLFEPTFAIKKLESVYDDAGRYLIGALSIYVTFTTVLAAYLKHSDSWAGPCTKSAIRFFNAQSTPTKEGVPGQVVDAMVGGPAS